MSQFREESIEKADCVAMFADLLDTWFDRKVNAAIFLSTGKLHLVGRRIDQCSVALVSDIICSRTVS